MNPDTLTSVAPIPPRTSKVKVGMVEPIPTFLDVAFARMTSVATSSIFDNKILIDCHSVHSPRLFFYYLYKYLGELVSGR